MKSEIPKEPSDQQEVGVKKDAQEINQSDVHMDSVMVHNDINGLSNGMDDEVDNINNVDKDFNADYLQSQPSEIQEEHLGTEHYQNTHIESTPHFSSADGNTRHLYNDVYFEAEDLDKIAPPEFSIQDFEEAQDMAEQSIEPFIATEEADLLQQAIDTIPPIQIAPKLTAVEDDIRYEPQLNSDPSLFNEHFSATPDTEEVVKTEDHSVATKRLSLKKRVRGSKLGMGWFQGFSLFIALLVFIALAIFAYFMLGERPLYDGDIPKYVLVGNEESGAMAALNPALPEEIRKQYIYIPKVERSDNRALLQDRPILDQQKETKVTKVELASSGNGSDDVIISEEAIVTHDNNSSLELLSIDHNAVDSNGAGLSAENLALIEGFILQGDIAYQQGFYVGTDQDDAYYYYQSALAIDPYNTQALQGIANIANAYYVNARNAYNYGSYDVAAQYVALGLAVQPDHSALLQLQQLIEQIVAAQHHSMETGPNYDSFNFNF